MLQLIGNAMLLSPNRHLHEPSIMEEHASNPAMQTLLEGD